MIPKHVASQRNLQIAYLKLAIFEDIRLLVSSVLSCMGPKPQSTSKNRVCKQKLLLNSRLNVFLTSLLRHHSTDPVSPDSNPIFGGLLVKVLVLFRKRIYFSLLSNTVASPPDATFPRSMYLHSCER